ncbi:hypothetical protein Poly30_13670 [Planctomycetes bacterium Poly30]|uniref:Uncharacterized protein n=1 Tax=Saltatorellus ferox TaxID=2528018 RepID=A0A518EP50_9BACT|nr:hypothetical protein Poly30_13670 [Planctomycetes bacterium Poly30]
MARGGPCTPPARRRPPVQDRARACGPVWKAAPCRRAIPDESWARGHCSSIRMIPVRPAPREASSKNQPQKRRPFPVTGTAPPVRFTMTCSQPPPQECWLFLFHRARSPARCFAVPCSPKSSRRSRVRDARGASARCHQTDRTSKRGFDTPVTVARGPILRSPHPRGPRGNARAAIGLFAEPNSPDFPLSERHHRFASPRPSASTLPENAG